MKIWELQAGQTITYSYYGESYTSNFKSYREVTVSTKQKTFLVFTDQHCLATDEKGQAVAYNSYQSEIK